MNLSVFECLSTVMTGEAIGAEVDLSLEERASKGLWRTSALTITRSCVLFRLIKFMSKINYF